MIAGELTSNAIKETIKRTLERVVMASGVGMGELTLQAEWSSMSTDDVDIQRLARWFWVGEDGSIAKWEGEGQTSAIITYDEMLADADTMMRGLAFGDNSPTWFVIRLCSVPAPCPVCVAANRIQPDCRLCRGRGQTVYGEQATINAQLYQHGA